MAVQNREMELTTRVEMPRMERLIAVGDRLVFLGSCFAEYIGRRFGSYGMATLSNPLGVLYNPESVRAVVASANASSSSLTTRILSVVANRWNMKRLYVTVLDG